MLDLYVADVLWGSAGYRWWVDVESGIYTSSMFRTLTAKQLLGTWLCTLTILARYEGGI